MLSEDMSKLNKVLLSCKTQEHLDITLRMIKAFRRKYRITENYKGLVSEKPYVVVTRRYKGCVVDISKFERHVKENLRMVRERIEDSMQVHYASINHDMTAPDTPKLELEPIDTYIPDKFSRF